jgi:hypothetical protein
MKVGTIAFNAVKTVVSDVFTPDTIAELATVGLSNPVAAALTLAAKVPAALMDLVPPSTQTRWVSQAFETVKDNVTDNRDLFNIATLVHYSDTIAKHESYAGGSASPTGQSPTAVAAAWFAAAAHDLAGAHSPGAR